MKFALLLAVAVAGCNEASKDDVSFEDQTGSAADLDECHCSYHSGVYDDPALQITCLGHGEIIGLALFLQPGIEGEQSAIVNPMTENGIYGGGGFGMYEPLGEARRDAQAIVRSLDGIDFRWLDQDDCDIANGCGPLFPPYHFLAGALHVGSGQCEDYDAEINDDL